MTSQECKQAGGAEDNDTETVQWERLAPMRRVEKEHGEARVLMQHRIRM